MTYGRPVQRHLNRVWPPQRAIRYRRQYDVAWSAGVRGKLGLSRGVDQVVVSPLVEEMLVLLRADHVDHTSFYRGLALAGRGDTEPVHHLFTDRNKIDEWVMRWRSLEPDAGAMDRVNPLYIPRNHLVEEALSAATDGDLGPFERLVEVVAAPYDERPGLERYAAAAPAEFGAYRTFCGT